MRNDTQCAVMGSRGPSVGPGHRTQSESAPAYRSPRAFLSASEAGPAHPADTFFVSRSARFPVSGCPARRTQNGMPRLFH